MSVSRAFIGPIDWSINPISTPGPTLELPDTLSRPVKLIIQIPCLNEEKTLPATIADLPRQIEGVDQIELLVIDDGSTDRTVAVARGHGVEHIVRLTNNKGLAAGFQAGLDACLKLGADRRSSTPTPITSTAAPTSRSSSRRSSPARPTWWSATARSPRSSTSPVPRRSCSGSGSWVVRRLSGTEIADTTSGFRAYNREAALQLLVVDDFTYTLESLIQAGKMLVAVDEVEVGDQPPDPRVAAL